VWRKGQFFHKTCGKEYFVHFSHVHKNEVDPYLTPFAKINSERIKDPYIRAQDHKTPRRKKNKSKVSLYYVGSDFSAMIPKAQTTTTTTTKKNQANWIHQN
jgi:hypothetical protein